MANATTESAPLTIISEQKVIRWVDGLPVPATRPIMNVDSLKELAICAMSLPYDGYEYTDSEGQVHKILDEEYKGMTNGEVMMVRTAKRAASGDLDSVKELLDRAIGKPKQTIDTRNLNLNYQDFLDEVARMEDQTNGEEDLG